MFVANTFWAWTSGSFTTTLNFALNPSRRYLVTGALTGKRGGDYGQIYISTVCTQVSNDQILCGVRDLGLSQDQKIRNLGIVEILTNATRVTIRLEGSGGLHRAEGVIFDIT